VYLAGVRDHLALQLRTRLPAIAWFPPEGTYLSWLDANALNLRPSPSKVFLERGRVALNDGAAFGRTGAGFVRLNFGTSRAIVSQVIGRMVASL
jgi:cystathionine beta-lyase